MADDERCAGCDRSLGWIDAVLACPNGCAHCVDCGGELGVCAPCGEPLRHRAARARALPGR